MWKTLIHSIWISDVKVMEYLILFVCIETLLIYIVNIIVESLNRYHLQLLFVQSRERQGERRCEWNFYLQIAINFGRRGKELFLSKIK